MEHVEALKGLSRGKGGNIPFHWNKEKFSIMKRESFGDAFLTYRKASCWGVKSISQCMMVIAWESTCLGVF